MMENTESNMAYSHERFTKNVCNIFAKKDNILLSPTSIHVLLSIACEGSKGDTKRAFKSALGVDTNSLAGGYKQFITNINSLENVSILIDNKIYIADGFNLQENFNITISNNFLTTVEPINFSQNDATIKKINTWIEDKSRNKIKDMVKADDVTSLTRSLLTNSIYFKSDWENKFSTDLTSDEPFYINEDDFVEVPMMHVTKKFKFKEDANLNAKILELPYKGKNISLIIILPNKKNGIGDLEQKLEHLNLSFVTDNMQDTEVEVSLPRFKVEETNDLNQMLTDIGLGKIFNTYEADFTYIINADEPLYIDKVIQKAFMEVTEEGIEVAATTIISNVSEDEESLNKPIINMPLDVFKFQIKSKISNRFCKTIITSKVENFGTTPQESIFSVVLPDKAFITEFVMEIEGKIYKAYIKEKEEAKNIYSAAVTSGKAAAQVAMTARDSNNFDVSVNVQPKVKATFILTYEELLQRQTGHYEVVLNIKPGQIVQKLNVEVEISESKPLKFVKTPQLRSGNEVVLDNEFLNPHSEIVFINESCAVVKFNPNVRNQKMYSKHLGNSLDNGFSGQFVVQYDVERDVEGGEILLSDGYFVHFFASDDLAPLPRHIVFVLDISGSMMGTKIKQLSDALGTIFPQLEGDNFFSIVEFNSTVAVWDLDNYVKTPYTAQAEMFSSFVTNRENITKAKNLANMLYAGGGTDIHTALMSGLNLVSSWQKASKKYQPLIIFLTDGEPTVGVCNTEAIINQITIANNDQNITPIFTLSFGDGADKKFLRKLSLKNNGFSRHIYEASDASLQLQDFFKVISSPLLSNVTFKYDSEVSQVTNCDFPLYFLGSELIVSGIYQKQSSVSCVVNGRGCLNLASFHPKSMSITTPIERLWAYLSVKQILEKSETAENKANLLKEALEIALKYSFVTEVTSLVVVKPENSELVDPIKRDEMNSANDFRSMVRPFRFCNLEKQCLNVNSVDVTDGRVKLKRCKKRVIRKQKLPISQIEDMTVEMEKPFCDEVSVDFEEEKGTQKFSASHRFLVLLKIGHDDTKFSQNAIFTILGTNIV